ncbi:MAG: PAS domain-containing protein [Alphaproteobacteria bacterium]|nr:PAS domain-containing protein [Alphaproteobacteria bacterium]
MGWIQDPAEAEEALGAAPRLLRLYRYWRARCDGRRAPARADIDPLDLPDLLPNLWLMDVEADPLDFRNRLAGTATAQLIGRDVTGKRFAEIFTGPDSAEIFAEYRGVVESWRPHAAARTVFWADRSFIRYRRLVTPLSADGRRVDMLFGLTEETV